MAVKSKTNRSCNHRLRVQPQPIAVTHEFLRSGLTRRRIKMNEKLSYSDCFSRGSVVFFFFSILLFGLHFPLPLTALDPLGDESFTPTPEQTTEWCAVSALMEVWAIQQVAPVSLATLGKLFRRRLATIVHFTENTTSFLLQR